MPPTVATLPPALPHTYYINANASHARRSAMELQLRGAPHSRWPAVTTTPALLGTHAALSRGVDQHLLLRDGRLRAAGTVATYLSFVGLLEHLARSPGATFLVMQDDVELARDWQPRAARLAQRLDVLRPGWTRCLLVWFGAERPSDCAGELCDVRPPAGPINGTRYFHGAQASLWRAEGIRCALDRLAQRPIKSIDAALVNCGCPGNRAQSLAYPMLSLCTLPLRSLRHRVAVRTRIPH